MNHIRYQGNYPLYDNVLNSSRRECQNLERTTEAFKHFFERGGESGGHELLDVGIIYLISDS